MRRWFFGTDPCRLAGMLPAGGTLHLGRRRHGPLGRSSAFGLDCGGRDGGRVDPPGVALAALRGFDLRHCAGIAVDGLDPAPLRAALSPAGPPVATVDPLAAASPAWPAGAVVASLEPLGLAREVVSPASEARWSHVALAEAAAALLAEGAVNLRVEPDDPREPFRARERAARALARAALAASGRTRRPLVIVGGAVLRAVASACRVATLEVGTAQVGLRPVRCGGREWLVVPDGPASGSPG